MTTLLDEVIEREVNPGIGLFEVVDDPELVGASDWPEGAGSIRIAPGRLGLLTAGRDYRPEIVLRAWTDEPTAATPATDVVATVGHEPVMISFEGRQIEVWSGDVTPGTVVLTLPDESGDSFWVRVTVDELGDHAGRSIDDYVDEYFDRHDQTPVGVERFTIDVWPAKTPT